MVQLINYTTSLAVPRGFDIFQAAMPERALITLTTLTLIVI
jgi:hypothetical protein